MYHLYLDKYWPPLTFWSIDRISPTVASKWHLKCVEGSSGRWEIDMYSAFLTLFLAQNLAASTACFISLWILRFSTPNFNRRISQSISSIWHPDFVTEWSGRGRIDCQFRIFSLFDHQLHRPFNISMNIDLLGPIFYQDQPYTYTFKMLHWFGV